MWLYFHGFCKAKDAFVIELKLCTFFIMRMYIFVQVVVLSGYVKLSTCNKIPYMLVKITFWKQNAICPTCSQSSCNEHNHSDSKTEQVVSRSP